MGHILARPDGELHPVLQIEERNLAVLELGADDASRREAQSISIKRQCSFQIVYTDGNHGDSWFHSRTGALLWRTKDKKFKTGYVLEKELSTFRGGMPRAEKRSPMRF